MPETPEITIMVALIKKGGILQKKVISFEVTKRKKMEGKTIVPRIKEEKVTNELKIEEGETFLADAKCNATQLLLIFKLKEEYVILRFSLGLAAFMAVVDEKDLEQYPFTPFENNRSRKNFVMRFENTSQVLVVLDCLPNINYVQIVFFHFKLDELPNEKKLFGTVWLGAPDVLNRFAACVEYIRDQFLDLNTRNRVAVLTLTKLLCDDNFFNGIGGYLRSEILCWADALFNLKPWDRVGEIDRNYGLPLRLCQLLAIAHVLTSYIVTFDKIDIREHNFPLVKRFWFNVVTAYRKPGTWQYTEGKDTVYTYCEKPNKGEAPGTCEDVVPLWFTSLGVGPFWWHSFSDFKRLDETKIKGEQPDILTAADHKETLEYAAEKVALEGPPLKRPKIEQKEKVPKPGKKKNKPSRDYRFKDQFPELVEKQLDNIKNYFGKGCIFKNV